MMNPGDRKFVGSEAHLHLAIDYCKSRKRFLVMVEIFSLPSPTSSAIAVNRFRSLPFEAVDVVDLYGGFSMADIEAFQHSDARAKTDAWEGGG